MATPAWIFPTTTRTRGCTITRTRSWGRSPRTISATSARAPTSIASSRATTSSRQSSLARRLPRRWIPLRLRAELLGRAARRRLRQPRVRDLPAQRRRRSRRPALLEPVRRGQRVSRSRSSRCAEQLEGPEEVLRTTYSNSTWQNRTFDAARAVARGDRGRLSDWGLSSGCSATRTRRRRTATSSRKPRCNTSRTTITSASCAISDSCNPDEAGNPLFLEGDRSRWFMLQPYLIALLMSKGMPMLWQGEEFAENYSCRISAQGGSRCCARCAGTTSTTRPGQPIVALVRKLLRIRRQRRPDPQRSISFSSTTGLATRSEACCCSRDIPGRAVTRSWPSTPGDSGSDSAVLVSDRRQLCRGTPRWRPGPERSRRSRRRRSRSHLTTAASGRRSNPRRSRHLRVASREGGATRCCEATLRVLSCSRRLRGTRY